MGDSMWTSEEMKQRAKDALQGKYWAILGVSILGGVLQGAFFTLLMEIYDPQDGLVFLFGNYAIDMQALIRIWIVIMLVSWIYSVFVGHTIWIGLTKYYLESADKIGTLSTLFDFFKSSYWNVVKITFLYYLKIALWLLCFVVPGIIKLYEYRMVPFILAENPDMNSSEVFKQSALLTQNNKWNIFVLELSFLGWILLGVLCCGIGVMFVAPYVDMTMTQLYLYLKEMHGLDKANLPPIPES